MREKEEYKTIYRRDSGRQKKFRRRERKGTAKHLLLVILIIIAALLAVFFGYTAIYYHMDQTAEEILETGENIEDRGDYMILYGDETAEYADSSRAIIFYPGGKVEYTAYLPLLNKLQKKGVTCVLIKVPFNLAFFDIDAAAKVQEEMPEISNWILMGHSLGGVAASSYYADHEDDFSKMILLGCYIYGDVENRNNCLVIYGTEDVNLDLSKVYDTDNTVVIEGGNHAQFGNYGVQSGDGTATISRYDQQTQAVQAILDFIN